MTVFFTELTCVVVKEAYVSVFVRSDCEGEGGVANYFVNLRRRWIICKDKEGLKTAEMTLRNKYR